MHKIFRQLTTAFLAMAICSFAFSQPKDTTRNGGNGGLGGRPQAATSAPKPYNEVITKKAVTYNGFFKVHKEDGKYYFEIPDSLLGRDILTVNRLTRTQEGMGYGGDQIGQNVIRFESGPNNKIFLKNISYAVYAKDSTSPMFNSVRNSNVQPIAAAFDIKAFSKDSTGVVIDMTDYINGDNDILYYNSAFKNILRVGSIQPDKSYIVSVKSYPINIEVTAMKTYSRLPAQATGPGGFGISAAATGNITVELNSSMVLLPKVPMQARYYDDRVGYFTVGYTDFDANPQGVKSIQLAKRWKLEPKPEDMEKYKRGELVEPQKPIVIYIDPATPKKWIPYLIAGINDWQPAFEQAGFKNAIIGKVAPTKEEDSTWSLEDARNSAIVYKPSDIANASGPSVADPRSGEIIETHINWYHNVMQLIRDWYMIQAGPNDPAARQMVFPDELMGQLIRFVSSHEVGHTMGLRHNFGSSSTVPVDSLRNRAWVEANGHTPSIMDYARFNYVAQPEDNISEKGLFPRIGDYDKWAIEWGYRLYPQFKSADDEKGYLNQIVINKLKNPRLWWGDGESNQDDPRSQTEDLGDDAMKASSYGIKNLQRIIPQLMTWTKEPNDDYSNLAEIYGQVTSQFSRYMGHVARNVAGIYRTPKVVEQPGAVYEFTPKSKQVNAVAFLNQQLFTTPTWLINNDVFARTGGNPLVIIGNIQTSALNRLFNNNTLGKLITAEASIGSNAYKMTDLFNDLKKGIWSELTTKKPIDVYRRNLQKSYVDILINLLTPPATTTTITISRGGAPSAPSLNSNNSDIKSVVRAQLTALKAEATSASAAIADPMTKYHLQDIVKRIDNALNPK
ncbi:MAG: zinc-dependent metalloprotease [Bacteroidetes bacterium]|nr:zinc-dependent metalloprotease [Bacteroidota bacterium]MBS1930017.1 zinc-dependent metalloprotease [Bacteroidota bacterium]